MYVVLDSNIWITELGLNSRQGKMAIDFIGAKNAVLIVPEVVRQEVQRNLHERAVKERADIKSSHTTLQRLLGRLEDVSLPTDERIEECVSGLIENTGLAMREIPMTLEAARSSYEKILSKLAPSDKNEQFRDGVIWANCIELLSESEVWLVSKDKAFYKNRKENEGPAVNLIEEAQQRPNKLRLFYGLEELLKDNRDVSRVSPMASPSLTGRG